MSKPHQAKTQDQTDPRSKRVLRLWLRLLSTSSLMEKQLRLGMREHYDVTLPQFDVMAVLIRVPEGLTMSEISRQLLVSNGNITGIAERLVADGLAIREQRPGDRRFAVLKLTERGRTAFLEMAEEQEKWIADSFAALSDREVADLTDMLDRAKKSVQARADD
jgi:DNA-binding MarR family transcriptional regulator